MITPGKKIYVLKLTFFVIDLCFESYTILVAHFSNSFIISISINNDYTSFPPNNNYINQIFLWEYKLVILILEWNMDFHISLNNFVSNLWKAFEA